MVSTRVVLSCAAAVVLILFLLLNLLKTTEYEILKRRQTTMRIKQEKSATYDYRQVMDELNTAKVPMDDPRLITLIRNYWLENPSEETYNLETPSKIDPSVGQAAFVDNRLNFKESGFFIECGALDGETRSNTLLFERLRHWNGLLIEGDPANYRLLKKKHRKAFTINACLSIYPYPVKVKDMEYDGEKVTDVQCFPFYSILLALNVTNVDFFSLDVEGAELQVLETIPFDKVNINMITAEFKHIKDGGERKLKQFVESKGYTSLIKMQHYKNLANDIIFRKI